MNKSNVIREYNNKIKISKFKNIDPNLDKTYYNMKKNIVRG